MLTFLSISDSEKARCFLDKVNFHGADLGGNPRVDVVSVEDCVRLCSGVDDCMGITFKLESKQCWLKCTFFTPQTNGYVSDYEEVTGSLNMDCLLGKPENRSHFKLASTLSCLVH